MARQLSTNPPRGSQQLRVKGDASGPTSAAVHYIVDVDAELVEGPQIKDLPSPNYNQTANNMWSNEFSAVKSDEGIV